MKRKFNVCLFLYKAKISIYYKALYCFKKLIGNGDRKVFFVDLKHILKQNTFYFHKNYCSCGRRLYYIETEPNKYLSK